MDPIDAQLQQDVEDAVARALENRRPIIHHLNADTSWLLQVPRPQIAVDRNGRFYYNILIDPWLQGPQSDVAWWFSQQSHATESKVKSIAEVEELAREVELLKAGRSDDSTTGETTDSLIDVVAISHEFTDHCHKETLLEVPPSVPVVATEKAAELIRSWSHFKTVLTTPIFGKSSTDWRDVCPPPMPEWLSISRIFNSDDFLYYHSALLIAFNSTADLSSKTGRRRSKKQMTSSDSDVAAAAEAVVYTPHGIHAASLEMIPKASPPLHVLGFLHGLHDVQLNPTQQLNLGAHNGLAAQRILQAKYWIGTHDEVKTAGGLVAWMLRRKVITMKEALEEEQRKLKEGARGMTNGKIGATEARDLQKVDLDEVRFTDLANGESRVLI